MHEEDERARAEAALRRYELLASHSRDIILFMRRDNGRLLEVNAAASAAYGYSREELLGLTIQDLRAPGTRALTAAQMDEADEHGILFETVHRRKDGSTFPVEVSSQGATVGDMRTLVSVVRDVSMRKQTEEALRESEQRWSITLASIGDAVIATDAAGRITFMNAEAERLTGWARADALQHPVQKVFNIVNETTHRRVEDPVMRVLEKGLVVGLANHTLLVRRDGTKLAIDDSGAPIRSEGEGSDGRILGVVLVFRDITQRRQAEDLLERQASLLEQTHDAIMVWHLHGGITYWNRGCEDLYGWPRAEALGRITHDLLQTEHSVSIAEVEAALESEGKWNGEVTHTTRDGRRIVVESRRVLVRERDGESLVMETNRDITERKRAEQALTGTLALTQELYIASRDIGLTNSPGDVLQVLLSTRYLRDAGYALIMTYDQPWTTESGVPEGIDMLAMYERPGSERKPMPAAIGQHYPTPRLVLDELQLRTHPWVVADVMQEPRISEQSRPGIAAFGIQAFAVFPLIANGVNFGIAIFYFDAIKTLSTEDVRHIQGLVDQAAVGIANQLALQMEQSARQQVEQANQWVAQLQAATAELSATLRVEEVAEVIVRHGTAALGAAGGWVVVVSQGGTTLETLAAVGYADEVLKRWQRFPMDMSNVVLAAAVNRNESFWLGSLDERLAQFPQTTGAPVDQSFGAWAAIPLAVGGRVVGGLGLSFQHARTFSAEERGFMLALAHQCGQALERARLYEAEAQARRDAERASELRLKFLAMISHELRTPLTPIKGLTILLLARDVQWSPDEQRDFLAIIDQETDKLTEMIEQLLDLSRLEAGLLSIHPQPAGLADILGTASPQLHEIAKQHMLRLAVGAELPRVRADGKRVAQVLANLVGNAAKYAPPGSTITVSARPVAGYLEVDVRDEGPGIPAAQRPLLFQAFHRGDDNVARQTKGAGLGLAICKGIVEAHGGKIWIQDAARDEPGTVISFTLPVA